MWFGILALLPAALFAVGLSRDPRSVRNATWLGLALLLLGLWALSSARGPAAEVLGYAVLGAVLAVGLVLPVAMIVNGLVMVRREGRRLGNLLSLLAGLAVLAVDAVFLIAVDGGIGWIGAIAGAVVILSAYAGFILVSLVIYAFVYARVAGRGGYDAVIVCGCGLRGDRVPPLLAGRLDRAAAVYRAQADAPLVVVSGGQGPDELVPEGVAMRRYLVEHGIPESDIAVEDRSTTTEENLRFSAAVLRERGRAGRAIAVTSNYHALRTAALARDLGLPVEVTGSRTALYFLPSAFLREVAALVVQRWKTHATACAALLTAYLVLVL
ncbi:YdcF family protein [Actinokineospora soli]|uniref:YdcF family protein n=1 Tax=Actinokineospora soli TaxID=1048753 RepID=A0ABW2TPE1_9PSEU